MKPIEAMTELAEYVEYLDDSNRCYRVVELRDYVAEDISTLIDSLSKIAVLAKLCIDYRNGARQYTYGAYGKALDDLEKALVELEDGK